MTKVHHLQIIGVDVINSHITTQELVVKDLDIDQTFKAIVPHYFDCEIGSIIHVIYDDILFEYTIIEKGYSIPFRRLYEE